MSDNRSAVLADIEKGADTLKSTETVDKSAPVIEDDVHIKTVDRSAFTSEVASGTDLKHVDTVDKSAPVIENVEVKTVDRKGQMATIQKAAVERELKSAGAEHAGNACVAMNVLGLKHTETVDKSAPVIEDVHIKESNRDDFKSEIAGGVTLKHTDTVDKSAPVIEDDVKVQQIDRKGQMATIQKAAVERELKSAGAEHAGNACVAMNVLGLKHAETVDKSAPVIEDVHIKKIDREAFKSEVASGTDLKHVDTVDKSAPVIEEDVKVQQIDRKAILAEAAAKAASE